MTNQETPRKTMRLRGEAFVDKVKELIHEGNVRRVVIKNASGHTVMEIPRDRLCDRRGGRTRGDRCRCDRRVGQGMEDRGGARRAATGGKDVVEVDREQR